MSVRKGSGFDSSFREHGNRDQFHAAFLSKPQHGRREQRCARGRPLRALPSSRNSLYTAAKGRNPTACGVLIPSTPSLGLLPSPPSRVAEIRGDPRPRLFLSSLRPGSQCPSPPARQPQYLLQGSGITPSTSQHRSCSFRRSPSR